MKTIVVPTDFSGSAQSAIEMAMVLAKSYNAELLVLHAYSPPLPDMAESGMLVGSMAQLGVELEKIAQHNLDKIKEQCAQAACVCQTNLVWGAAADVILEQSKLPETLMVVMGRRGEGGFLSNFFGTVTTQVVEKSACPVLVMPPHKQPHAITKILYATELEAYENNALGFMFDLAKRSDAAVTVLKITAPHELDIFNDGEFVEKIEKLFGRQMYDFQIVNSDSVSHGLVEFAHQHHTDLLVMATRRRNVLEELLHPSLSKKMVLHVDLPLLVCHLDE